MKWQEPPRREHAHAWRIGAFTVLTVAVKSGCNDHTIVNVVLVLHAPTKIQYLKQVSRKTGTVETKM